MKWIMVRTAVKTFGGSHPRIKEGALHHAWRGKNDEVFLISECREAEKVMRAENDREFR